MKRLIIFIYIISLTGTASLRAQPPDSINFLPLHLNDMYQFWFDSSDPYFSWTVDRDTVYPNNNRYFSFYFFRSPVRVDSQGNIFSAGSLVNTGDPQSEYLVLKANAKVGETWIHAYNINIGGDSAYAYCFCDDTLYSYGRTRRIKGYVLYDGYPVFYHWHAEGIGIFKAAYDYGAYGIMVYARINGKEYGKLVGVEKETRLLQFRFDVSQNFPNPFNSSTNIKIFIPGIPNARICRLKVFDTLGRELYSDSFEISGSRIYSLDLGKSGIASGTYFYQVQSGIHSVTKQLILLK